METVALNKLTQWDGNVRKTGAADGLDELVASISAHGLLNPLTVKKAAKGKFTVIAGQRRLMALNILADRDDINKDAPIDCLLVADDADATEISLAENVVRSAMHPADQFDAWRALADSGLPVADIAARFGVTEAIVTKRLKLGRVTPVLLDLYREGKMSLEQVQAFTVTDDQEEQARVWASLPPQHWNRTPGDIREALTTAEIPATDRRVKLIGLDAYEAAGGSVRRDLFDDRNAGWVADVTLLDQLVAAKMEEVAEELRAEGWSWVEIRPEFQRYTSAYHREFAATEHGKPAPMTPEEKAELKALSEEMGVLDEIAENSDTWLTDEQEQRQEKIEERVRQLNDRPDNFTKAVMKRAGAIITLGYNGLEIVRGLVRKADAPAQKGQEKQEANDDAKPAFSQSLLQSLTQEVTGAMQAELVVQPRMALVALLHSLCTTHSAPVRVTFSRQACLNGSRADEMVDEAESAAAAGLPDSFDSEGVWAALDAQPTERLLEILAAHVGKTVSADERQAGILRSAQNLDLRKWFTPDAGNYFGKVSKDQIIADLTEMGATAAELKAFEKMKKGELAKAAATVAAERATEWLPKPMRLAPKSEPEIVEDEMEEAA